MNSIGLNCLYGTLLVWVLVLGGIWIHNRVKERRER